MFLEVYTDQDMRLLRNPQQSTFNLEIFIKIPSVYTQGLQHRISH